MHKNSFLQQLEQYTSKHLQLATNWQQLGQLALDAAPAPGSWSASQCLQHLNSYGRYYLPALQKALPLAKQQQADGNYNHGWLGGWFARTMMPNAQTGLPASTMPAPADHRPMQHLAAAEVLTTFIQQQQHLLQLLKEAHRRNLNAPRIPITLSRFIQLKPGDVLAFLVAHNERHVQQAIRALQKQGLVIEMSPAVIPEIAR